MVFLGTAGAVPTVDRGSSAVLIIRGGERILVDCGEGTQRQLMRSAGLAHIGKILITHLHGDHYLGLPGLLKTLSLQGREEPLELMGPEGLFELLRDAERLVGRPKFPMLVEEQHAGVVFEAADYRLCAENTEHGIPSLAWSLEEMPRPGLFHPEVAQALGIIPGPDFGRLQRGEVVIAAGGQEVRPEQVMDVAREGRKIVISGDTRPSDRMARFAAGASVLVHDCTFASSEHERAIETGHSTAREAAEVALAAGVQTLVLIHTSSRHSWRELRDEARAVFPDAFVPRDFDELTIPYPEKGKASFVPPSQGPSHRGNPV
jgi:ribonuclease Z